MPSRHTRVRNRRSLDESAGLVFAFGAIIIGVLATCVLALVCKLGDWLRQFQRATESGRNFLAGAAGRVGAARDD